jgi:hypothetical protein
VTHPGRTPTWDEIEQFCKVDGWSPDRTTDHVHWKKTLESGEQLETHRSLAGSKSMSQNRFALILREQLKVSRAEFWEALATGEPVHRPVRELEPLPPQHPLWVVWGLKKQGYRDEDIATLTPELATELLQRLWSQNSS